MTDQPKPDKQPEQQDAPKSDSPPKTEATEAHEAAALSKPAEKEKPQTAPLNSEEPVKAPSQAEPAKAESAAETAKGDRPATLIDPTKPAANADANKPANGLPDAPGSKVEGIVTHDLRDARDKALEKSASGTGIPGPDPAKTEGSDGNSSASGEPKVTQRLPDPESLGITSGSAAAGIICPTCGHRNRPGVLLCENCGTNLMTGRQTSVGTRDLMREQEKGEEKLDAETQKAVDSAGGMTFTEDMVLRIEIEGGSTPMLVYPKQEIIMGRRDPNTGGMPDVDLTAYAGYRMGVSRRHAAIRLQDKQLNVSDLGSSNGTFLNGTRLNAHRPYPLRDGDEVRLGQMVLRLYFQSSQ